MHINVGKTVQRIDAVEKAAGTVQYLADSSFPGILHAKLVTSTHAHAKIKTIDTTEAWKVPGVRSPVFQLKALI